MTTDISNYDNAMAWAHQRSAGVLMPVFSLPSQHGIGDLGGDAYRFAEALAAAGQQFWQILPLNPTNASAGDSPYFSSSAFAGNPLLISLDTLVEDGLLDAADALPLTDLDPVNVEFDQVRPFKLAAIRKAAAQLIGGGLGDDFHEFAKSNAHWLDDYALFNELEREFEGQSWCDWPIALRDRDPTAMASARESHAAAILETQVFQFLFFRQWQALKHHCNQLGLKIFGDMPIYVSYDSADVWANPSIFKLNDAKRPTMVSGVPPDYFSETGQLWNNPVYNWSALQDQGYAWWIARMGNLFEIYDIVRIDHFRGLVQFWEVPAGSDNAIGGSWQDVPTYDFFDALKRAHPAFPVVVEDLGIITPDVVEVKEHYGLPGMLVMHFAFFDDNHDNPYKPENHPELSLVYLGTHDNNTTEGWFQEVDDAARGRLGHYFEGDNPALSTENFMRLALASRANIAILSAQDLLGLPARARINDPSLPWNNWRWRMTASEFNEIPWQWLQDACRNSARLVD